VDQSSRLSTQESCGGGQVREAKRYKPSALASQKWVDEWENRTDKETNDAQDKFLWLLLILIVNLGLVALMFALKW